MTRRPNPRFFTAAVSIVAVLTLALLWPEPLGGATTYVSTYGGSMAPKFQEGDLVLVRSGSAYRVGDVVAYRSTVLRTVVLHRIVDVQGGRYTLKGDSNSWRDVDRPTRFELIGRSWVRVPRAGTLLTRWKLTVAVGLAGLLAFGGVRGLGRGRRRRRERIRVTAPAPNRLDARHLRTTAVTLACTAAVVFALGAYALTLPAEVTASKRLPYRHETAFRYSAVGPETVYQDGLAAGEPAFLRVTRVIDLEANYELSASALTSAEGTVGLRVELGDASGWRRGFVIAPPAPFRGSHATARGPLDIQVLEDALTELRTATGTATPTSAVRVLLDVEVAATLEGHPMTATLAPVLEFKLDALRLTPPSTDPDRRPFVQSKTEALEITAARPNQLGLLGSGLDVRAIPVPAFLSAALAAMAAVLCVRSERRRLPDAAAGIALRLGSRRVPIRSSESSDGLRVLDVATIDDLVRLADEHGRLILHEVTAAAEEYHLQVAHTVYRFRIGHRNA